MVAKPLCPLYKNIIKPLDRARYPELRYKGVEITIIAKSGLSFVFFYDVWLSSFRKGECNTFYEDKPLYEVNGFIKTINTKVQNMIYEKIGLPLLSYKELGEAAAEYAKTH